MARWQFNPPDSATVDYPTFGFRAAAGQVADAPTAPDGQWMQVAGTVPVTVTCYSSVPLAGPTVLRPAEPVGQPYFDTDLGKPVWWNGTGWVDATGATA